MRHAERQISDYTGDSKGHSLCETCTVGYSQPLPVYYTAFGNKMRPDKTVKISVKDNPVKISNTYLLYAYYVVHWLLS